MRRHLVPWGTILLAGLLAVPALGWQGRMAGMGDPYGLMEDESDFLIHPARIAGPGAAGGVKWYGHYGFTYRGVTDWSWDMDFAGPVTVLGIPIPLPAGVGASLKVDQDGDEFHHDGLLGATFPLGVGRMGLFFTYKGKRGDYDGTTGLFGSIPGTNAAAIFDTGMESDLDNLAFRAMYGLPISKHFKMGGEFQIAYQRDENSYSSVFRNVFVNGTPLFGGILPPGFGLSLDNDPLGLLFPFMLPHESRYWEALFKVGLEGSVGASNVGLTLRGGAILAGDNEWNHDLNVSLRPPLIPFNVDAFERFDMDGDVSGWRLGGDLWARFPVSPTLSLPFVLRADYLTRSRDGSDIGTVGFNVGPPVNVSAVLPILGWSYEHEQTRFDVEVGGGIDWAPSKGTRIGAGLYYNYIYGQDELFVAVTPAPLPFISLGNDFGEIPTSWEHRFKLKLTGETVMSPSFTLRGGLETFLGWVNEEYRSDLSLFAAGTPGLSVLSASSSPDGIRWGVGASVGATAKMGVITLEPYITGGYQEVSLDGGMNTDLLAGIVRVPWDLEKERREWYLGAGVSVLFGP